MAGLIDEPMKKEISPGVRARLDNAIRTNPNDLSMKALSEAVGKNQTYIQQFITKGSPRVLPEDVRRKLSQLLAIDEALLMNDDQIKALGKPPGQPIQRAVVQQQSEARDLPIMGRARAATDDALIFEGGRVGTTERPSYLVGVEDAFAIYIMGDSMYPRYKSGEIGYVNPHKPPMSGDDVLIEFEDGTGVVKELVRVTRSKVLAKQHNPKREITYEISNIKRISLIEGSRHR